MVLVVFTANNLQSLVDPSAVVFIADIGLHPVVVDIYSGVVHLCFVVAAQSDASPDSLGYPEQIRCVWDGQQPNVY